MKTYTEEDLRNAFRGGIARGKHIANNNYFDAPLDEDEYIDSLKEVQEEEKIPFTYLHLVSVLGWETFCDLTSTDLYARNEGFSFSDTEIFYITKSIAKEHGIIN